MPEVKETRKYLVHHIARIFHRVGSDMPQCQVGIIPPGDQGYSDSSESLLSQGFIPCPICCDDLLPNLRKTVERLAKLKHDTFAQEVD